jgi:hypothetical protein
LQELENIDDEADQLGIGFVKIHDELLANEYNLGTLPKLVYYRHETPVIYEGNFFHSKCSCEISTEGGELSRQEGVEFCQCPTSTTK